MKEVDDGTVVVEGDVKNVARLLDVFDLPGRGRAS
jgi:hypothetical protein